MIPAKPGFHVIYNEHENRPSREELVAWNSQGWPMVFRDNCLEAVYPPAILDIVEHRLDNPTPDFTQLIPVEDLHVLYRRQDGSVFEDQAIGWGVTTAGDIVPVVIEDGLTMSATGLGNHVTAFRSAEREATYLLYSNDVEAEFQAEVDAANSRES